MLRSDLWFLSFWKTLGCFQKGLWGQNSGCFCSHSEPLVRDAGKKAFAKHESDFEHPEQELWHPFRNKEMSPLFFNKELWYIYLVDSVGRNCT
jgi:hypothetical protein